MPKFNVALNDGLRRAAVLNDGQEVDGYKVIGHFDYDINDASLQTETGDHPYVANARKVLEDYGINDVASIVIEDKASNEPVGSAHTPTVKEAVEDIREEAKPDDLAEVNGKATEHHEKPENKSQKADKAPAKKPSEKSKKD